MTIPDVPLGGTANRALDKPWFGVTEPQQNGPSRAPDNHERLPSVQPALIRQYRTGAAITASMGRRLPNSHIRSCGPCVSEQLDRAGCSVETVDRSFEFPAEDTALDDGESHWQLQQVRVIQQG